MQRAVFPFAYYPTTICPALIYVTLSIFFNLLGIWEETGAEPMLIVHFLPCFRLSVQVVCGYGISLGQNTQHQKYLHPIQTQTPDNQAYHMEITFSCFSIFFMKPNFPLPHSQQEEVLNFRLMNSLELLCIHAFFLVRGIIQWLANFYQLLQRVHDCQRLRTTCLGRWFWVFPPEPGQDFLGKQKSCP